MKNKTILTFLALSTMALALAFVIPNADANQKNRALSGENDAAEKFSSKYGYDKKPTVGTRVKCPVMVGSFNVKEDTAFSKYKDKWYAFCCKDCKTKFDSDPEKYLEACPEDCPCPD